MQKKIDELRQKRASLYLGGGEKRIARQHEKGKLTARERLGLLFDEDTFQEANLFMEYAIGEELSDPGKNAR
jgi:acetyl-CoA carboxylase carboxyltransferase component